MHPPPAETEFTLSHGGNTVRLRLSLRAALRLERLHDGFANLFRRVDEFDTGTIREIILTAASDRKAAEALLSHAADSALSDFTKATHGPVASLCRALVPAPPEGAAPRSTSAKKVSWAEAYAELYRIGTGWLHWTSEATWNATPAEISEAFEGHIAMLKVIHGNADDTEGGKPQDETQRAANEAAGLDPDFDRAGLMALKHKIAGNA